MRAAACALGLAVVLGFGSCGNGAGKPTGQIVLQASGDVTPASLEFSTGVMRKRLEKLGIPAEVSAKGTRVIIRLPQENIGTARRVLPVGGALELFDLQGDLVGRSLDETGFPRALTKPPAVRSNTVLVTCKKEERYCPGVPEKPSRTYYYLFRYDPENKTHP